MGRDHIRRLHKDYLNAGLVGMLSLLNFDRRFTRAEGIYIWDAEGKRYLDFLGGYGALNTGHNHPRILKAVTRVQHLPNLLQAALNPLAGVLAHNLAQIAPGQLKRAFFCNSGAEAVEGALKIARIATGRTKTVYCTGSFHGKTLGALSVTGRAKYQEPFQPLLPGCSAIPFGDLDALERALRGRDVAAFIVEPIQGEGGIIVPPDGYLRGARELCTRYGTLLIADEIQTGLGRTGKMFACEHEGVVPDILCLAKSLGGGVMPIGAYLTTDEIWKRAYGSMERALLHTSTFGGNSLACAAAIAALEVILDEDLPARAAASGAYLLSRLEELKGKYPLLKDVRGRGLLVGLEFAEARRGVTALGVLQRLSDEFLGSLVAGELLNDHGVLTAYTLNNPNVIRLEPPLAVDREHLDYVLSALETVLSRHKGFIGMAAAGVKTAIRSKLKGTEG
ncbi:MAG: aspartate aminotransferase family protein [Bacillota bacterium]